MFAEGERALVTHMVPLGTGVWIACRFSSVLTLMDSNTMQPLQQVPINILTYLREYSKYLLHFKYLRECICLVSVLLNEVNIRLKSVAYKYMHLFVLVLLNIIK